LLGPAIGRNNASRLGAAGNPQKKAASEAAQSFSRCFNQTSMIAMILWLLSTTMI
jgi:hypothetical protein